MRVHGAQAPGPLMAKKLHWRPLGTHTALDSNLLSHATPAYSHTPCVHMHHQPTVGQLRAKIMDSRRSAAPVGHRHVTEVGWVGGGVSAQCMPKVCTCLSAASPTINASVADCSKLFGSSGAVPPFGMGWQGDSAGEPCQAEAVAFHITAVACPKGGSNINGQPGT